MSVCHSILPVSHSISDKSCLLVMQLYRTVRYSIVTCCRKLSISITADWKSDRCARCIGSTKRITSNGVRVRVGIGVENQKRRAYDLVKTSLKPEYSYGKITEKRQGPKPRALFYLRKISGWKFRKHSWSNGKAFHYQYFPPSHCVRGLQRCCFPE